MPDDRNNTQTNGDPNAHKHGFTDDPNSTTQANDLQQQTGAKITAENSKVTSKVEKAIKDA